MNVYSRAKQLKNALEKQYPELSMNLDQYREFIELTDNSSELSLHRLGQLLVSCLRNQGYEF